MARYENVNIPGLCDKTKILLFFSSFHFSVQRKSKNSVSHESFLLIQQMVPPALLKSETWRSSSYSATLTPNRIEFTSLIEPLI